MSEIFGSLVFIAVVRQRDFELTTEGANGAFLDFAMTRQRRNFAVGRDLPKRVGSAFAGEQTAVRPEMALDIEPLYEATSFNGSRTAAAELRARASSR